VDDIFVVRCVCENITLPSNPEELTTFLKSNTMNILLDIVDHMKTMVRDLKAGQPKGDEVGNGIGTVVYFTPQGYQTPSSQKEVFQIAFSKVRLLHVRACLQCID
jgi:hypothetical protein